MSYHFMLFLRSTYACRLVVRRPYDIGDRIAIANADTNASLDGSATWFVQSVGLFTTTVRFAATNEVATLANGSLAASRVINAKRSTQANCYVYMKFSVDVPYSKVLIFRKAVEDFIKDRPREWIGKLFLYTRGHDDGSRPMPAAHLRPSTHGAPFS